MNNEDGAAAGETTATTSPATTGKARLTPALVLAGMFWLFFFGVGQADIHNFYKFMARFAGVGVLTLGFAIWYLMSRHGRISERLAVLGFAIAGGVIALAFLRHPSVLPPAILF